MAARQERHENAISLLHALNDVFALPLVSRWSTSRRVIYPQKRAGPGNGGREQAHMPGVLRVSWLQPFVCTIDMSTR
jgi:hypothetical protein